MSPTTAARIKVRFYLPTHTIAVSKMQAILLKAFGAFSLTQQVRCTTEEGTHNETVFEVAASPVNANADIGGVWREFFAAMPLWQGPARYSLRHQLITIPAENYREKVAPWFKQGDVLQNRKDPTQFYYVGAPDPKGSMMADAGYVRYTLLSAKGNSDLAPHPRWQHKWNVVYEA